MARIRARTPGAMLLVLGLILGWCLASFRPAPMIAAGGDRSGESIVATGESAGSGRHRGGMGLRRTIRVLGEEATFLGTLDRARIAPWGLAGGGPGGTSALVLNAGTPGERALPPKLAGLRIRRGDTVTVVTPGAGGYGPPTDGHGHPPAPAAARPRAR